MMDNNIGNYSVKLTIIQLKTETICFMFPIVCLYKNIYTCW